MLLEFLQDDEILLEIGVGLLGCQRLLNLVMGIGEWIYG